MKCDVTFDINEMEIRDGVIDQCVKLLEPKLFKSIEEMVSNRLNEIVDKKIYDFLNTFLTDKEIIVTDKWGDVTKRYETGKELLKEKFDSYINHPVDNDGKEMRKTCGYSGYSSRIEYLISKSLKDDFRRVKKETINQVNKKLEETVKNIKAETARETLSFLHDHLDLKAAIKNKQ